VIAESFAEIFFGNCTTLGIPCVVATGDDIKALAAAVEADPALAVTVDVDQCRVFFGDQSFTVHVPDSARDALISGKWDPIAELLESADEVSVRMQELGYSA
jgi:3-isopropylmalate/(R)-2-methylmalate dehydratase small subunit